jgi:signal transduction histidine kinase
MNIRVRQRGQAEGRMTESLRSPRLSLTRLRWITIAVPIGVTAILLPVLAVLWPEVTLTPSGYLTALAFVASVSVGFSYLVFATVERLERRVLRQNARLTAAASAAEALSEPDEQSAVMLRAITGVCEPLGAEVGIILLTEGTPGEPPLTVEYGGSAHTLTGLVAAQRADGLAAVSVLDGDADADVLAVDDTADGDLAVVADVTGLRSLVSVPIVAHGRSEGRLLLASARPNAFDGDDVRLITQIGQHIGIAVQHASLLVEVVEANAELRLVNGLAAELAEATTLPEVIDLVSRVMIEAVDGSQAEFWLDDDGGLVLAGEVTTGPDATTTPDAAVSRELRIRAFESGEARFSGAAGIAYASLPLRSHGGAFAVVSLVALDASSLTPQRRHSLESIAEQSGPAVSNVRLRLRAREMAVLEERSRIAREMHDGLAQVLAYVNTKAAAVRYTLARGDARTAAGLLAELEEAARDVSADVREDMLALRNSDPGSSTLCRAIREYLKKYERLSGIRVQCLEVGGPDDVALPEMTQLQIIRVIQEALSNVRKHAGVTDASVTLSVSGGSLEARVDDEGQGFAADAAGTPNGAHYGLQTMRERAESVGAEIEIQSRPGAGTHVGITVPLKPIEVYPA